jgi:membrane fusion protein, heavy metal efflux system
MNAHRAIVTLLLACSAKVVLAGPGHDHGPTPGGAMIDAPQRLSNGSTFLPKPSQRQLGVRTLVAKEVMVRQSIELAGRVIMDPNAGGKVQASLAGRIAPGPRGLPSLGQRVNKGDVLAIVHTTTGVLERANQAGQIAELRASRALAEKRVARLEQLAGTVPRKDIEAAQSELQSLTDRLSAIGTSLATTESLTAPVSGVISAASAVAGQVVDAREVVFEIIDPNRLRIEALIYDPALVGNIATASASHAAGKTFPLEMVGAGRTLKDQALPIHFRTVAEPRDSAASPSGALAGLAIGQPVQVVVQTRETLKGIPIPAAAIVKSPSNQDIVWVHAGAEIFVAHPVRILPLDGERVTVMSGLHDGDRVVVHGASLVNQVR